MSREAKQNVLPTGSGGLGPQTTLYSVNIRLETYMRFALAPFRLAVVLGPLCALVAAPVTAQEQSLLSAEIRTALDEAELDAAQQRFDELFPSQQEQYRADYEGLAAIATEYMQA